ncbi:hypothetical protein BO70DRAFT_106825 [Aspergillus heteromorphus CBS 117.55]|uniref:Uncharacterized protein n=1 Tax=Aspergillus heteromorphus CBS 117.55 TaxID=1448321 RepID=A0A317VNJ0_9EURO|nr:uncharacterized protein BO70DRAFT_106825 [Aspergillus heteromorphus CBS 117.55]PWY74428.1 hypothetical protein BO70DRAFT_106825 [Aspergillus heteromorphus CBS 117.55]
MTYVPVRAGAQMAAILSSSFLLPSSPLQRDHTRRPTGAATPLFFGGSCSWSWSLVLGLTLSSLLLLLRNRVPGQASRVRPVHLATRTVSPSALPAPPSPLASA